MGMVIGNIKLCASCGSSFTTLPTAANKEYMNVSKQLQELKASSKVSLRDDENFTALKKQLEATQKNLSSTESNYKEMLQLRTCIDTEKSTILEAKKEADAIKAKLESSNASLQEELRMEKLRSLELQEQHDRDEDKLSVLIDEMTQLKLSEQEMVAHAKEMEKEMEKEMKRKKKSEKRKKKKNE